MRARRFGLRSRVITAFGIGALLLSGLLSGVTYSLTRANVLEERQDDAFSNAVTIARNLDNRISEVTEPAEFTRILGLFAAPEGSQQGLVAQGQGYFDNPLFFGMEQLDPSFVAALADWPSDRHGF